MNYQPGLWSTRFSDQQYRMIGKPDSMGWAKFQCLNDLQRIREWHLSDMRPLNDEAAQAVVTARAK